ncbi:MAG TPA: hypothetical protein VFL13_16390 [Candidatus Baltobacteraceae bacterium]|nr:hypothetical protein [Candidatus Baltobacteraceae bacterium]
MSEDSSLLQALSDRVTALERQSRRLKVLLGGAFVLVLALGAVSGTIAQPHSISFAGPMGTVKLSADGLWFYDKHGTPRLAEYISADHRQPVIRMRDSSNRDAVYFGLTERERPRISFMDPSNNERLYVGLTTEETGLVRTFTSSGKEQTSLEDDFLRIRDTGGTEQIYIGVSTDNTPILKMFDASHTERVYAGLYSDGKSGFSSYDSSGSSSWSSQ